MKITHWPIQERPREKLLHHGADKLSDAELLAIFINTGTKDMDAVSLARQALEDFGSLRNIMTASKKRLLATKGVGLARYVLLQASLELHRRSMTEMMIREQSFTKAEQASQYLISQLRDKSREVFVVLMLDSQHQLIAYREMFSGTIDSAAVYPREIVKQALEDNAAAVILAHNHPSGHTEPSQADKYITEKIVQALALVDIIVLDHFVVGDSQATSFAQRGLL
ncbi:RadC family protein [Agaribacter flavus]|uniref:DNA repair protein RadC n=1 Tax=Agaribacter flavus TaxID=1902781 RepID=A0ABV7FRU2_9ALTE